MALNSEKLEKDKEIGQDDLKSIKKTSIKLLQIKLKVLMKSLKIKKKI